jgi:hypothetical protein
MPKLEVLTKALEEPTASIFREEAVAGLSEMMVTTSTI